MTKGLQRSLSRAPISNRPAKLRSHLIPMSGVEITVDGATGVGWGTVNAGALPEGNIVFQTAVAYLQFTGPTSANLVDTWNGDFGVGTTPADDATITGTDVDLVPSTAVGPAVAEVSPRTRGVGSPQATFDNTASTLEVNVNLLIDDADIDADGIVLTILGEIELLYTMAGDD